MDRNFERELYKWFKMVPDGRCSITIQGCLAQQLSRLYPSEYSEFCKHMPMTVEERARFCAAYVDKYGKEDLKKAQTAGQN